MLHPKAFFLFSAIMLYLPVLVLLLPLCSASASSIKPAEEQSVLQEIDIWIDQHNQLFVKFKGEGPFQHQISAIDSNRKHSLLPGTLVSADLVRLYRLDEFDHGLQSLLVRNSEQGAKITWVWLDEPGFTVQKTPESITFRLGPDQGHARASQTNPSRNFISDREVGLEQNLLFPGMQREYSGEPVFIDLQNAEVEHVLRLITSITDYNLIMDEGVRGKISLRLQNVPWDQALDLVLRQKDLDKVRKGNIIRVTTADRLEDERKRAHRAREDELRERVSLRDLEPLQQELFRIKYANAHDLKPSVEEFLTENRGRVIQDERTNTLIIRDTPSQLQEIRELIRNLDRPERQVLIEARVVHATESFRRELGIDWQFAYKAPGLKDRDFIVPETFNFPTDLEGRLGVGFFGREGKSFAILEARLRLGESEGKSRTISAPQIMTLNNQRARIEQGTNIAVTVVDADLRSRIEYVPAILELIVIPQITPDNNLILNVQVKDDAPGEGGNIDTKRAETTLFVEDGETIVIGGIKQLAEMDTQSGIPGVSRIPVLGWLFKHEIIEESMDELLIFIRPQIL